MNSSLTTRSDEDSYTRPVSSQGEIPLNSRPKGGRLYTLYISLALFLGLLIGGVFWGENSRSVPAASAQVLGTFYTWADSVATSTSAVDSAFTTRWEELTLWPVGADLYVRVGAPDTSSWSSRKWLRLDDGYALSFGPANKIQRLEYKTVSGLGALFLAGTKRVAQW